MTIRSVLLATLLVMVTIGCGGGAAGSPSSAPGSVPRPATTSAPGATEGRPSPSAVRPQFEGTATVRLDYGGATHTLEGGRCEVGDYGADMGGGSWFAINIGTMSLATNGPDYFGLVINIADAGSPDGTYDDLIATASVDGESFNINEAKLTVHDGGKAGEITGRSRATGEIEGTFAC